MGPEGFTPAKGQSPDGARFGLSAAYKGFNSWGGTGWDFSGDGVGGGFAGYSPSGAVLGWPLTASSRADVCSWWEMHHGVLGVRSELVRDGAHSSGGSTWGAVGTTCCMDSVIWVPGDTVLGPPSPAQASCSLDEPLCVLEGGEWVLPHPWSWGSVGVRPPPQPAHSPSQPYLLMMP